MAFEVVMPKLGWASESARLVEWVKQDGDEVDAGEVLFLAEGDKAAQEVEALESGVLHIGPAGLCIGEEFPVGTVLAYLVASGETFSLDKVSEPTTVTASAQESQSPPAAGSAPPAGEERPALRNSRRKPAISPRAARVAAELDIDWTVLKGSGRTGRIVERDVRQAAAEAAAAPPIKVTPVAQRLAAAEGIDLTELAAHKAGEKIRREDVEALIAARDAMRAPATTPAAGTALPITRIRRVIAGRMVESGLTTAPLTLTTEADATELVALREKLKATLAQADRPVPSYNDLLIKLTAGALLEHPLLNAYWAENEIVVHETIHIATAVDTEAGLLVPVIRDVPGKSLQQIATEARALAEKARSGQLMGNALQGGTFTITNLGTYGIDAFTPIINLPGQCAILGVGRIISKPAAWQEQIALRKMMALSLTFDHRVVDGGPAARFLNTVREYVEQPYLWLTA
jgi:pyruvate dehydrogenase E2 component (dihydrolipoamide acetyltransferase)